MLTPQSPEEYYYREFLRFEEGKSVEQDKLDNVIFIVTTGTLVLSINYVISLGNYHFKLPALLILCWITLLASLIVHAIGYRYSIKYHKVYINNLKDWAGGGYKYPFSPPNDVKLLETEVNLLNKWSFWLMIAGLIFLMIFVSINFLIDI